MGYSVYIADDEENVRELIRSFLESDGYAVTAFATGDGLMAAFEKQPSDLVILDIMMPGTDGLTVCRRLRERTTVPIILLTAKDTEYDYVQGITLGGDDYLTKPFRPTVLLMRVRALLRRVEMNRKTDTDKWQRTDAAVGDLRFSAESNRILCRGAALSLTKTELRLLSFMMHRPDRAYTREELLSAIWGYVNGAETRVTDETLRRIRRKLTAAGSAVSVQTVWGIGYRLRITETEVFG